MKQGKASRRDFLCSRETPFGPVAVIWSSGEGEPEINRILLSGPAAGQAPAARRPFPALPVSSSPEVRLLLERIEAALRGEQVHFAPASVCLDRCSPFQREVLSFLCAIPRGGVTTYRFLAERLGRPQAARAVGMALATNPFPIVIPCHRVIRSDGALGGYQGGLKMKRALLEREAVAFRDAAHVDSRSLPPFHAPVIDRD